MTGCSGVMILTDDLLSDNVVRQIRHDTSVMMTAVRDLFSLQPHERLRGVIDVVSSHRTWSSRAAVRPVVVPYYHLACRYCFQRGLPSERAMRTARTDACRKLKSGVTIVAVLFFFFLETGNFVVGNNKTYKKKKTMENNSIGLKNKMKVKELGHVRISSTNLSV